MIKKKLFVNGVERTVIADPGGNIGTIHKKTAVPYRNQDWLRKRRMRGMHGHLER